jgi:hypothetical protein
VSFFHFLTVGFLDREAVRRREVVAIQPLSKALLALLPTFLDEGCDSPQMEGSPVEVTEQSIRCPWYTPRLNRKAEAFARKAQADLGCVIADVEHAQIVMQSLEFHDERRPSLAEAFDDVLAALDGKRFARDAGVVKVLRLMLQDPAGCDATIDRARFSIRFGWHSGRQHTYFRDLAPGVVGQLLDWSGAPGTVRAWRGAIARQDVSDAGFDPWSFTRRFLWVELTDTGVLLAVREAVGSLNAHPVPLPEPDAPPLKFVALDLTCPHCSQRATRYRQLSCGGLVCGECGCSFKRPPARE